MNKYDNAETIKELESLENTRTRKMYKSLKELGQLMINECGKEACAKGYKIDASNLEEVGRQALLFGDINLDGTIN